MIKSLVALIVVLLSFSLALAQETPSTQPIRGPGTRPVRINAKPINPNLPTLWIIGDSTVKNGADTGDNGQWGWGNPIASYFDQTKINIQNRALGGTSSRTFWRDQWPRVLAQVKPGDYVIMQFGHNDGGAINDNFRARASLKGNGEEVEEIDNMLTHQHEVVHTYGWYLRKIMSDAKEKGAAGSIVCSPIPRNNWRDGKMNPDGYSPVAEEAAKQMGMPFIALNAMVIKKFMDEGQEKVTATYFPERETTHPDWAGAVLIAQTVIEGMKQVDSPLVKYLLPNPPTELKNPSGKPR